MKRIKKFESFNHRVPKEVSFDDCRRKREIHGTEAFTKKEIDFFKKLEHDYVGVEIAQSLALSRIHISTPHTTIEVVKLRDDWYYVYDFTNQFNAICDEWDEVLGFLETKTNSLIKRKNI